MEDYETEGVKMLLGNPKRAVIMMALPMVVALVAQAINNVIDAVWVAGLGPNALAAVGFVFPLFFMLIGIGFGIGVGASSAIGRNIGCKNKLMVDKVASQGMMITIIIGIVVSIILLIFQKEVLVALGAGETLKECLDYSTPMLICSTLILINGYLSMTLRAEGAAKRSMNTQILTAVINIILDPIFIYKDFLLEVFKVDIGIHFGLGMGMSGAAWATIVSILISLVIVLYWYFVKNDTYAKIRLKLSKFEKAVVYEIFRVGIPSSIEMIAISSVALILNAAISTMQGGTDNVAVFSSVYRVVMILIIPLEAIGGGIVPVFSTAFGAKRYDKMKEAYSFSLTIGTGIEIVILILTEILAPFIVLLFTYSDSTESLKDSMVTTLRILSIFLPFLSWGYVAIGQFQSMGMGLKSLGCTIIKNGLQVPAAFICIGAIGTFSSVVWAITASEIIGSLFAGGWSLIVLLKFLRRSAQEKNGGVQTEKNA